MLRLLFLFAATAGVAALQQQQDPVKAVVTILFDDLGFHDLGYTGSLIKTPHIDKLRREGLLLTNHYVQPICTPSRGSFNTGRYALALGLQGGMTIQPQQTWGLPLNETTVQDVLSTVAIPSSGTHVQTHAVGKWHLGGSSWQQTPTYRGSSSFYGYYLGAEDYYYHSAGPGYDLHNDPTPNCGEGCSKIDWGANGTYSAHLFAAHAAKVIANHNQSLGPLYLYMAFQSVHAPVQAPASYVEPYLTVFNNSMRQVHAGMVAALDEAVGNLTTALQNANLLDSCVIVATSDNGGPVGDVQPCADCNGALNFNLRGGKHSLYEGGTRSTSFVWSSLLYNTTAVNRTYSGLAHITDWFPTILSWFNVSSQYTPKPGYELHGFDQSAALAEAALAAPAPFGLGSTPRDANNENSGSRSTAQTNTTPRNNNSPRSYAIINIDPTCNGTAAIRQGDWKFIMGDPGPPYAWDPEWEISVNDFGETEESIHVAAPQACAQSWPPTPPVQRLWPLHNNSIYLYNLTEDPREMNDVSSLYPQVVSELTQLIESWAVRAMWPVQNATIDPNGSSKKHNGTWVPWL